MRLTTLTRNRVFFGSGVLLLAMGCNVILDLDEVRDSTATGGGSGGVAGNVSGSVQGAGRQSSTGGAVSEPSFGWAGAGAPGFGGASAASPSTGGTFGSGRGSFLAGAGGSAGESTISAGGSQTNGGSGGVATSSSIVAGAAGAPPAAPKSCQNLSTLCQGESCCTTIVVPGGTFKMGRGGVNTSTDYYSYGSASELPEHDAIVTSYVLDKYEVTVGRFRRFAESYDTWHSLEANPKMNAGADPNISLLGWGRTWTTDGSNLPADSTALKADVSCSSSQTWSESGVANETYAINCVKWYVALAFCIWDGGRLPTEAEWEYAAAGGSLNNLYPWGVAAPGGSRAVYSNSANSPFAAVGSRGTSGAGRFGHQDLAGSMWEWVFDGYSSSFYGTSESPAACSNCANWATDDLRGLRGGAWTSSADTLRAAYRGSDAPVSRSSGTGFRCARNVQF